tara:strand:- start:1488 stop:1973 length:486 start_codon:yes stop_codon:yes gene_type:complete
MSKSNKCVESICRELGVTPPETGSIASDSYRLLCLSEFGVECLRVHLQLEQDGLGLNWDSRGSRNFGQDLACAIAGRVIDLADVSRRNQAFTLKENLFTKAVGLVKESPLWAHTEKLSIEDGWQDDMSSRFKQSANNIIAHQIFHDSARSRDLDACYRGIA